LVKYIPKEIYFATRVVEIRSRRSRIAITKGAPHRIVEELAFFTLNPSTALGGDSSIHDGVKTLRSNNASLKWIHVKIADGDGS